MRIALTAADFDGVRHQKERPDQPGMDGFDVTDEKPARRFRDSHL
jgi:hypothetical protein